MFIFLESLKYIWEFSGWADKPLKHSCPFPFPIQQPVILKPELKVLSLPLFEEPEDSPVTAQNPQLPPLCKVCKLNQSKYTCPGCFVRSCSLPCVKAHKQHTGVYGQEPADPVRSPLSI